MAVKSKNIYQCSNCGYTTPKWFGRCPDCGEWNTLEEQVVQVQTKKSTNAVLSTTKISKLSEVTADESVRYKTGINELDRVLGGGIVVGSVILLSGDPGIGKSTLLLQLCKTLDEQLNILYVSGEESMRQIKLRAERLGVNRETLYLSSTNDIEQVVELMRQHKPNLVIIDSIQTMNLAALSSSSGSVTQVRECTQQVISVSKSLEIPVFIVGHVNKDGAIAGPKVLEHMVDTVLYFEGDKNQIYRVLRAVKNRFGSTNEIGVFEMNGNGLVEVLNPSAAILEGRPINVSGTCVCCIMEGSRPILAEVQALVSKTGFPAPRRTSTGYDYNRTSLIIAILEKRGGYFFGNLDTFVNVVGGLRLDEPAADLSIALSLISNLIDKPVPSNMVAIGELGLAGEVRVVSNIQTRVKEAYRLGFDTVLIPKSNLKQLTGPEFSNIQLIGVKNIGEAISILKRL